jgi:hypothetical protein
MMNELKGFGRKGPWCNRETIRAFAWGHGGNLGNTQDRRPRFELSISRIQIQSIISTTERLIAVLGTLRLDGSVREQYDDQTRPVVANACLALSSKGISEIIMGFIG